MPLNPDIYGPATLSVSYAVTSFSTFLPKLSDVRKSSGDADMYGDVRMGEVAAVTITVGIGAIASSMTGSYIPALTGALVAAVLVCIYESALRNDKPLNPKGSVLNA